LPIHKDHQCCFFRRISAEPRPAGQLRCVTAIQRCRSDAGPIIQCAGERHRPAWSELHKLSFGVYAAIAGCYGVANLGVWRSQHRQFRILHAVGLRLPDPRNNIQYSRVGNKKINPGGLPGPWTIGKPLALSADNRGLRQSKVSAGVFSLTTVPAGKSRVARADPWKLASGSISLAHGIFIGGIGEWTALLSPG